MRVSAIKTEERVERPNLTQFGVAGYGKNNDYPQKLMDVIASSGTASKCVSIYSKFVAGDGFADEFLNELVINSRNETLSELDRQISKDIADFNGFCLHINYNENGVKTEVNYCPLEYIRFEMDQKKFLTGNFKYYEDWDGRKYGAIDSKKIITLKRYNPDAVKSEILEVRGIDKYNGQLLYVSFAGSMTYPRAIYDPVVSDISTEDAIATIKNRNAKNNFLTAGMLVKKGKDESDKNNNNNNSNQDSEFTKSFKGWQGENNACKIIVCEVDFQEEAPQFVPFDTKNFDKEFTYTEESVQKNIGNVFNQPPVLRGELIAGKLGTSTEIEDAYYYYNIVTTQERNIKTSAYKEVFDNFIIPVKSDFEIKSLTYTQAETQDMLAVKLGVGGTQALTSILLDPNLGQETKIQLLIKLFAFTEEDAKQIIYGTNNSAATTNIL